jgi:methyl-accepting chemotaxis protein
MSALDFQIYRIRHIAWKARLKSFLEGRGGLTEEQALSHKDCGMGKWMYSGGLSQYEHISEMQRLEKVHIDLHATVRKIVSLKNSGDASAAEIEFQRIGPISDELVALLTTVEEKVKSQE